MALKSFKDLYNLDISKHIQKKPTFKKENGKSVKMPEKYWLNYIEWATVIFLLYENGAEKVVPEFETNQDGYPAFFAQGKNPFVKIKLTIDDNVYNYHYPVIDGNFVDDSPNQMKIHRAQQRGLVKCVAINTGLGLKLWQKEEKNFDNIGEIDHSKNLPELLPKTENWKKVIQALNNGYKMEQIERKYYINEENREQLISESL